MEEKVRAKVRCCDRDCWMIGSVSPAMHKYIWKPATWVLVHKFKALFTKHPYSMYELKICRDYRDGKVTKEELDKCSTCDMNCVINNGLSEASKEQLKHKTGEEIVDADIAQQICSSSLDNSADVSADSNQRIWGFVLLCRHEFGTNYEFAGDNSG